jgi:large subunit ribosomal protein L23
MANPALYYHTIVKPVVTEKSTVLQDLRNQYSFEVHPRANKPQIKKAVETLFNVHVESVAVMNVPGKLRRILGRPGSTPPWKKALVKLRKGETIELV